MIDAPEFLRVVHFEETGEERGVVRGCKPCGITEEDIRCTEFVLSPTGVGHFAEEYGMTRCGRDATGDKWWWPL